MCGPCIPSTVTPYCVGAEPPMELYSCLRGVIPCLSCMCGDPLPPRYPLSCVVLYVIYCTACYMHCFAYCYCLLVVIRAGCSMLLCCYAAVCPVGYSYLSSFSSLQCSVCCGGGVGSLHPFTCMYIFPYSVLIYRDL